MTIQQGIHAASGMAALLALSSMAHGQALPTYPTTEGAVSTTLWAPDRYRPAKFLNGGSLFGRDNVLVLGVNESDGPGNRPQAQASTFFDTQGRKLRLQTWNALPYSFVASVRVPLAWTTSTGLADSRRTDMWGVVTPTGLTDQASALFPIFGFTNEGAAPAGFVQPEALRRLPPDFMPEGGGAGRYRVFDSEAGGFVDLPQPVAYDQWSDLCITLTNSALEYRLDDVLVYTDSTISVNVGGVPTQVSGFLDVIMQAKNYGQRPTPPGGVAGVTYDSNWSSLAAGSGSCNQVAIQGQFGADLSITKSVAPATVAVGQTAVFTLTARNNGPAAATGVFVLDTLPAGLQYLSNSCGASFAAPALTWTIGNLALNQTASCALTVQVTAVGVFVNTALIDADQSDPVFTNNSSVAGLGGGPINGTAVPTAGTRTTLLLLAGVMLLAALQLARRR